MFMSTSSMDSNLGRIEAGATGTGAGEAGATSSRRVTIKLQRPPHIQQSSCAGAGWAGGAGATTGATGAGGAGVYIHWYKFLGGGVIATSESESDVALLSSMRMGFARVLPTISSSLS